MPCRACLFALISLALSASASAQFHGSQLGRGRDSNNIHLRVRVVLPNGHVLDDVQSHVQVINSAGSTVDEADTNNGTGEAVFSDLSPGSYRIHVSGGSIESTEKDVDVSPFEDRSTAEVEVHFKSASADASGSMQGTVSAHALNVPAKARKEVDKGNDDMHKQDWAAAEQHFRKAIEIYPQFPVAYNNLGVACLRQKNYGCARDSWRTAATLDASLVPAQVNLARLRIVEHDLGGAESLLQKALGIEPLHPDGLLMLSNVELALGKFDLAVAYARKVPQSFLQLFLVAHLIAGRALEAEKKFDEAAAEYKMIMAQTSSQDPAAMRAQDALARLHQPVVAKAE
jgi:tetratricopeptide (TPR) repeat protein